jgi:2-polyprenyl-3-methyl-5-hydroxy-6-metoxy-1,4-benzoquinol methylase
MFAGTSSSPTAKQAYVPLRDLVCVKQITLGANTSAILATDPKLLLFTLSKYKFAGKLLVGKNVLELGCMDGTGSILLSSMTRSLTSVDFYKPHISDCLSLQASGHLKEVRFLHRDLLDPNEDLLGRFDGVVCFDVLEHLDPTYTERFFAKATEYMRPEGVFICGMPSLESQAYASEVNKKAHINCMSFVQFITHARKHFSTVLPFGMNDEVIHTGYYQMCHYNIIVCSGIKHAGT